MLVQNNSLHQLFTVFVNTDQDQGRTAIGMQAVVDPHPCAPRLYQQAVECFFLERPAVLHHNPTAPSDHLPCLGDLDVVCALRPGAIEILDVLGLPRNSGACFGGGNRLLLV